MAQQLKWPIQVEWMKYNDVNQQKLIDVERYYKAYEAKSKAMQTSSMHDRPV
jgi:hypothetical protein